MQSPPFPPDADDAARVQVSKQFHLHLDEPLDWIQKVRRLRISGWCLAKQGEPLVAIRAQLRGRIFPGYFDRARPDVATYLNDPAAPRWCGFTIDVRVPFGRGRLELQVAHADGKWRKAYARNVWGPAVASWAGWKSGQEAEAANMERRFRFWCDCPTDWSEPVRDLRVSGWCVSKTGEKITALRGRIGRKIFLANYGFARPDVVALLEGKADALQSGFFLDLEVPRFGGEIVLEARGAHSPWAPFHRRRLRGLLRSPVRSRELEAVGNYKEWIRRHDTLSATDRRQIRQHLARFPRRPLISVVMPVYRTEAEQLRAALDSVRAQLYPHWELCIADDASPDEHVRQILTEAASDPRIRLHFRAANGGIAATSNDALALTKGDYVALVDHDDILAPGALYFIANEINQHPKAQLIYSDEDKLDALEQRTNPHFKSDWNHALFLAQNFVSHLSVVSADLIKRLRFRAGFEGSQDYDLILRAVEELAPAQIRHIPRVLYHWRMTADSAALNIQAKPKARLAAIKAVQEHLDRRGVAARVERTELEDYQRIRYQLPSVPPKVSLIIHTRDLLERLQPCVASLLARTTYPNFEILLIDNGTRDPAALAYLERVQLDPRVRLFRRDEEFNYGQLNNFAVGESDAEFVALLNNDLTVETPDWLEEMVGQALQPGVGAVGARLLFPDGRIQHGGVILGAGGGGLADHAHKSLPRDNHGYFSRALLAQELSAVTAACMLVRRSIYLEVGGFDAEHLKVAFNDVDFCLRLRERGYRIIYTPYAEFLHWESASRGLEDTREKGERFWAEVNYVKARWPAALAADPFYNPNLALNENLFTLAFPPRLKPPWLTS
ncbi:MAG: glycosyltransferase family 2 protein [Chthoniobacterales bacterium]